MNRAHLALGKLTAWKFWFASWQLGTRPDKDPECSAVKDHREVTLALRAEVSALVGILIDAKVITLEAWLDRLEEECKVLDRVYEERFPGVYSFFETEGDRVLAQGLGMDPEVALATMKRMGFKP